MIKSTEETNTKKPEAYLCCSGELGCRGIFDKNGFHFHLDENLRYFRISTLCRTCEKKIGYEYGLNPHDADAVETALQNMDWYYRQIPTSEHLEDREKIRALLLAGGLEILQPTDLEKQRAEKLRARFPTLTAKPTMPKLLGIP